VEAVEQGGVGSSGAERRRFLVNAVVLLLSAHTAALLLLGARNHARMSCCGRRGFLRTRERANGLEDAAAAAARLLEAPLSSYAWILSLSSSSGDAEGETAVDGLRC
jgi:hypothetical protein